VFKENLTEIFYLSVIGILALMFGALIINLMFNLTRIADKHNQDNIVATERTSKKLGLIFSLSFPLVFGILIAGDFLTSKKKEKMLIASGKSIFERNSEKSNKLLNYSFDKKWIVETSNILQLFAKMDTHFPSVSVIVADSIDESKVFLAFGNYFNWRNDSTSPMKKDFIQKTTKPEREYLDKVFYNKFNEIRFSASDGRYELFFPYQKNGKTIVLYFSDYQRYGKIGS
jgi:hypothetical protein